MTVLSVSYRSVVGTLVVVAVSTPNLPRIRHVRDHDIRPVIEQREFTSLLKAWNARLDSDLYHRRNMNETVNTTIKQKYGAFVRSRLWWKQFRELVIKCVVHNLERTLAISREEGDCL
jgi:IS5 family transposase